MSITIRFADASDAALIAELSRQTFYETFAAANSKEDMDKFMTEQFTTEKLMEEVGAPNNIFFLAMENEKIVGYARLRENNKPPKLGNANTIEIARIYAVTSSIGKGVGRMLMQKSLDIAAGLKKDTVW